MCFRHRTHERRALIELKQLQRKRRFPDAEIVVNLDIGIRSVHILLENLFLAATCSTLHCRSHLLHIVRLLIMLPLIHLRLLPLFHPLI